MPNYNNETRLMPLTEQDRIMLNEIMKEFALISDVNGVAIAKRDGSRVFCYEYEDFKPSQYIDNIFELISNDPNMVIKNYKLGMFTQSIVDVKGHKILLASLTSDIVVMFILEKSAYVGLAMLIMEGFLREIEVILFGGNT
jgi:predicted regulator of Ras-like GTPase activity (Roadblock/LC7/MglB family)